MKHRWLNLFDSEGNWHGNPDRSIRVNGEVYDMDEYAKEHGIELPSGPNKINKDIKEKHEDLDESHGSADTEVDGDGDSEG